MAQKPQIIDITKSYLPGDPNSLVQNLVSTEREDGEEKTLPVIPYEGYNFLPTSYGYKSFFGTNGSLEIDVLTSRVQYILLYQLPNYQSRLIALCEDGIWICNANVSESPWQQAVTFNDGSVSSTSPYYNTDVFEEWTWCVIENVLYMYQQGRSTAWKTSVGTPTYDVWSKTKFLGLDSSLLGNSASNSGSFESWDTPYTNYDLVIVPHTPNFLNMAGQMGIFRAGTRLGFWDSSNSVSWSSNLDLTDFTPSLENLAGNTIFGAVVGRIVTIKGHGEGYIVYTTRSIIGVTFSATGNLLWDAKTILASSGILSSKNVTSGLTDSEHFVYSNTGIYTIGKYNSLTGAYDEKNALPDLYDYLKESRDPIALQMIQSRYIFFSLVNADYIYGRQSFYNNNIDPYLLSAPLYTASTEHSTASEELLPEQLWDILRHEQIRTGQSHDPDEIWVPLYTTTIDRMDSRYYSRGLYMIPGDYTLGLVPYSTPDTALNTIPLTSVIIDGLLTAVSSRFGSILSFADIRAFANAYGGDPWINNESLITIQMSEWEDLISHMIANRRRLEATTDTSVEVYDIAAYDTGNGYTVITRDDSSRPTHVTKAFGSFITGQGNIEWLITDGPAVDAARELIMRKTFNKIYQVTKDVRVTYVGTGATGYSLYASTIQPIGADQAIYGLQSNSGTPILYCLNTDSGNSEIYSIVGDPSLPASYTAVDLDASYAFINIGGFAGGIVKNSGGTYYVCLIGAGNEIYYSTDGLAFTNLLPDTQRFSYFKFGAEFLSTTCYHAYAGDTNLYSFTAVGSVVSVTSSVATSGLALTLSTDKVMFKLAGILYLVEVYPSVTVTVKLWSSADGIAWSLVNSFSLVSTDVQDKITVGSVGYFVGQSNDYISIYKVTATDVTLEGYSYCPQSNHSDVKLVYIGSTVYALTFLDTDLSHIIEIFKQEVSSQTAVSTYTTAIVTQNSGYSQFRALVTAWDKIRPGLYGNYTLVQRVPASAMTPKIWDSIYPSDKGDGRDKVWAYSEYKATPSNDVNTRMVVDHSPYYQDFSVTFDITLPGSSFLLQSGSIETSYSTYVGALVYDIQLKKWGKYKGDFKALLETVPVNSDNFGSITATDLGANAGIIDSTGAIYLFDSIPADSWIRWGKIGYYRLGFINMLEVRAQVRYGANFQISTQGSMDGKEFDVARDTAEAFNGVTVGTHLMDSSARWHSVKISGNYDLTGLEVRGTLAGRR